VTQLTKGFFTDHSLVCTGVAQVLLPDDPQRQAIVIHNPDNVRNLNIGFTPSIAQGFAGTITLIHNLNTTLVLSSAICTQQIYVLGTTVGQGATCWTYP
jgi:hypothetical protein